MGKCAALEMIPHSLLLPCSTTAHPAALSEEGQAHQDRPTSDLLSLPGAMQESPSPGPRLVTQKALEKVKI